MQYACIRPCEVQNSSIIWRCAVSMFYFFSILTWVWTWLRSTVSEVCIWMCVAYQWPLLLSEIMAWISNQTVYVRCSSLSVLNYTHMGYYQKHVYLYQTISRIDCKESKLWAQSVTRLRQMDVFHKDRYSDHCFSISCHLTDLWLTMLTTTTFVMTMIMCMCYRNIWKPIPPMQWSGSIKTKPRQILMSPEHLIMTTLCRWLRYEYLWSHYFSRQVIKKMLGVTLDDKLNFNEHIRNICQTASCQINALNRIS